MKHIYLVRHCKAAGQEPEAPLTLEGNQQAELLGEFFINKNVEYIISSPYERAKHTIRPLSERLNLRIHTDNRLQERVLSIKQLDNWMELLERTYIDDELLYEGGESSNEATTRGMKVINEMLQRPEKTIVIVTHGALLSLLIRQYKKQFGFEDWKKLTNPDVYKLEVNKGEAYIERIWQ
ncbi:histidine phosphatase family protein [Cohnella terricola]|uniref:Histidine phosphatase family protein n=1 Tax=Cohnella terricola TaxID=1289167 RepID=A0A559IUR5_9BACL|nr:histidine phosphatase family protein [Cohnella terricola]TVX91385.1 histidine phosphatase family protein [Cohnella terricola]